MEHDEQSYGSSGPLKVSFGGHIGRVSLDFLDLARRYDTERTVAVRSTDVFPANVYGVCTPALSRSCSDSDPPFSDFPSEIRSLSLQHSLIRRLLPTITRWICSAGRRSDTAHNFVYPPDRNPNLHFLTEHLIKRVIIK